LFKKVDGKMSNFEGHIQGDKPVVVDFFAEWCAPCKMMGPVLAEVKEKIGERATIVKMDIDKNRHYAELYAIQAVPTLVIFKNGKVLWRHSGVTPANDILKKLAVLL
jgi:thioredoxin 1